MVQGDRTLVIMSNNDVYFINQSVAEDLIDELQLARYAVFRFDDLKSGSKVIVQLRNISSLVKEARRG